MTERFPQSGMKYDSASSEETLPDCVCRQARKRLTRKLENLKIWKLVDGLTEWSLQQCNMWGTCPTTGGRTKAEIFWLGIEILMHKMGYIRFGVKKWKQPWFFLVLFCIKTKKNNANRTAKLASPHFFLTWPKIDSNTSSHSFRRRHSDRPFSF